MSWDDSGRFARFCVPSSQGHLRPLYVPPYSFIVINSPKLVAPHLAFIFMLSPLSFSIKSDLKSIFTMAFSFIHLPLQKSLLMGQLSSLTEVSYTCLKNPSKLALVRMSCLSLLFLLHLILSSLSSCGCCLASFHFDWGKFGTFSHKGFRTVYLLRAGSAGNIFPSRV